MASASDKFLYVGDPGTATTLSAPGYTIGAASINVGSTTNFPSLSGVIFGIDNAQVVNGVEERIAGSYCVFAGTVASGTSINNLTLLYGTPQNYAAGALTRVYITVSALHNKRLIEGLLAEHTNPNGYHALTSNSTITSAKFLTALNDTNGNELVKVTATASAVNEFTIANAATGNGPILSATGGDTNVPITISPKGTGKLTLNNLDNPYKFRAYLGSAQNTGAASFTVVNIDTENFDSNNNFNTTTHQYTAPVSGFYYFSYTIAATIAASETYEFALYVNGSIYSRGTRDNVNTVEISKSASDMIQLTAADTVEIRASSANARAMVTGTSRTYFSGFLISRT